MLRVYPYKKLKILVVEDVETDARIAAKILKDNEFFRAEVVTAKSLAEMKTHCGDPDLDIILLDLHLPDSPLEFYSLEAARSLFTQVPIVVLTSNPELSYLSLKNGAQDYLIKGRYTAEMLCRSVLYSIERYSYVNNLEKMALVDSLTEVYNRAAFLKIAGQQLNLAMRNNYDAFLIFIDVDNMKSINDAFGHPVGDKALKGVAAVLYQTMRASDVVGRFGGDEFVVFGMGSPEHTRVIRKRLLRNLVELNTKVVDGYSLSLSWGVAPLVHSEEPTLMDLISRADKEMYIEKSRK
jgi:two-component system, cell cycle response regulator